jgi:hypothetical protein
MSWFRSHTYLGNVEKKMPLDWVQTIVLEDNSDYFVGDSKGDFRFFRFGFDRIF